MSTSIENEQWSLDRVWSSFTELHRTRSKLSWFNTAVIQVWPETTRDIPSLIIARRKILLLKPSWRSKGTIKFFRVSYLVSSWNLWLLLFTSIGHFRRLLTSLCHSNSIIQGTHRLCTMVSVVNAATWNEKGRKKKTTFSISPIEDSLKTTWLAINASIAPLLNLNPYRSPHFR